MEIQWKKEVRYERMRDDWSERERERVGYRGVNSLNYHKQTSSSSLQQHHHMLLLHSIITLSIVKLPLPLHSTL